MLLGDCLLAKKIKKAHSHVEVPYVLPLLRSLHVPTIRHGCCRYYYKMSLNATNGLYGPSENQRYSPHCNQIPRPPFVTISTHHQHLAALPLGRVPSLPPNAPLSQSLSSSSEAMSTNNLWHCENEATGLFRHLVSPF